MKKLPLAILAASLIVPAGSALARGSGSEGPSWNYVEVSYLDSELEQLGVDLDPDGWEINGVVNPWDFLVLDLSYSEQEDNVGGPRGNIDGEIENLSAGAGMKWALSPITDMYARVAYEDWKRTVDDLDRFDETESGYSYAVGVRSVVWDIVELRGDVGRVDVGNIEETRWNVGAYVTFAGHFTIGASYTDIDVLKTFRGTVRYQF